MCTAVSAFILSLCCIGDNKVIHVFSIEKVIMFDFFLLGCESLLYHRITHIYMMGFDKNKGNGALFPCVDSSFG